VFRRFAPALHTDKEKQKENMQLVSCGNKKTSLRAKQSVERRVQRASKMLYNSFLRPVLRPVIHCGFLLLASGGLRKLVLKAVYS
jgi:hypothetical protein